MQPVRARVKSTSSLQQHQQPVIAQHFTIPPPASVPSSRRSTSSLSSTPPTPVSIDTLMPACPTGWARFDLSPLNEVTQDTSSSAAGQGTAQSSSDTQPRTDESQPHDFANFPSSSATGAEDVEQSAGTEGHMTNDKFSDSFLGSGNGFDDAVKQGETGVASSSFEMMSPSSDKDSISLPSPEAPPPPLPENIVTTDLPSEPPVPPPRPRAHANNQVGLSAAPVTPSSSKSDSVHSSPVLPSATADESPATKPPATVSNTSVISNHSQHITSSGAKSRFTVQPSSVQSSVNNAAGFPLSFPSDDATPPPLPPRNVPVSSDMQKQQLMRGISLPSSGKIHLVDDVPPPPPPRRSLSKPVTSLPAVDPFAPIPVSVPVSSVPAKHQTAAAAMLPFPSSNSVVETTIAPLPRPRPHLRQTQLVTSETSSSTIVPTGSGSGSSSPWHSVSTPPIIEPVDPFSNVDPFAGSVSPDDPFAEPSLDGMLSDLCHDFDSDTLSTTAFRTRAVTIDSASSDICDSAAAVSSSVSHQEASSASNELHFITHGNVANVSPVVPHAAQPPIIEPVGTGCLVDLNSADDTADAKWQPFADKHTASSGSQALSGFAVFEELRGVDWKPASSDTTASNIFDSSVSTSAAVGQQLDSALVPVSDVQPVVSVLDTCASNVVINAPGMEASNGARLVTDAHTSDSSLQTHSVTSTSCTTDHRSTTDFDDIAGHSLRARSEPPAVSQVLTSTEHRNSSFDAVFDDCFTSSAAASAAANSMSLAANTDVAIADSNATCISELAVMPSLNSKQHDSNSAHLPVSDVQVIH